MRLLLFAGCFAAAAIAQTAPPFRSDVELVAISCAVVDAHGAPVQDLKREDFRVFDNDVPRIVEYLWHDSDQPLTLAVLIDASTSQHDLHDEHMRTAAEVVKRFLRPGDQALIVSVSDEVRLWSDLNFRESERLSEPCPRLSCGESPLWNAVYDTARLKLYPLKGPKAILLLTDGFDSGSTRTWKQAADEAQAAGASVYAIQYRSDLGGSFAPLLYRLITETGGTWFSPPEGSYGDILSRLDTDLRRRYVLGFRPEKLHFNKPRHDVRVEVTRPELTVRARKVYFQ